MSTRAIPEPVTAEDVRRAGRRVHLLARYYTQDAALVARICDEETDRSGRLLGEVRVAVRESGRRGGYPDV